MPTLFAQVCDLLYTQMDLLLILPKRYVDLRPEYTNLCITNLIGLRRSKKISENLSCEYGLALPFQPSFRVSSILGNTALHGKVESNGQLDFCIHHQRLPTHYLLSGTSSLDNLDCSIRAIRDFNSVTIEASYNTIGQTWGSSVLYILSQWDIGCEAFYTATEHSGGCKSRLNFR